VYPVRQYRWRIKNLLVPVGGNPTQSKRRTHGWQIDPTPPFIGALATRTVHPPAINVLQLRVVDAERGRKLATREIPGNAGPTRGIMEVSFPPSNTHPSQFMQDPWGVSCK
jgi:hypothetical protein